MLDISAAKDFLDKRRRSNNTDQRQHRCTSLIRLPFSIFIKTQVLLLCYQTLPWN